MTAKFVKYKIGDVAKVQGGYAFKSSDFQDSGVPVFKITNVQDRKIDLNNLSYVSQSITKGLERFFVKSEDVLISMTGNGPQTDTALVGRTARYSGADNIYLLNQRLGRFLVKEDLIRKRFLYYLISRPEVNKELALRSTGSANQANINATTIETFEISVPDLKIQDKIVKILGDIDDKIELNSQSSETLEAKAKAIFKEWFINFGAVKAKSEGKKPFGMDEETASLFPNSFEDSEYGPIPKDWKWCSLDSIATYLNGLALQKYPPSGVDDLPVVRIAQLRANSTKGSDFANNNVPKEYILEDGDIVFSWSGTLEVKIWTGGKGALNQHLFKVTSETYPKWFFWLATLYHLEFFRSIASSKATTMGHIQRSHLAEAKIACPHISIISQFDYLFIPIIEQLISLNVESKNLEKIRDLLLPKLISGEISVNDV